MTPPDNISQLHKLLDVFSTVEEQLIISNAYLAAIFENAEEAILAKNLDGTLTAWNPAAEKLYGYSSEEVIGEHIDILVPDSKKAELDSIIKRIAKGELIKPFQTIRLTKDKKEIPVTLTISPIKDRTGSVIGASAIAHPTRNEKSYGRD